MPHLPPNQLIAAFPPSPALFVWLYMGLPLPSHHLLLGFPFCSPSCSLIGLLIKCVRNLSIHPLVSSVPLLVTQSGFPPHFHSPAMHSCFVSYLSPATCFHDAVPPGIVPSVQLSPTAAVCSCTPYIILGWVAGGCLQTRLLLAIRWINWMVS